MYLTLLIIIFIIIIIFSIYYYKSSRLNSSGSYIFKDRVLKNISRKMTIYDVILLNNLLFIMETIFLKHK